MFTRYYRWAIIIEHKKKSTFADRNPGPSLTNAELQSELPL